MSKGLEGLPGCWMFRLCRISLCEGIWGPIGVEHRLRSRVLRGWFWLLSGLGCFDLPLYEAVRLGVMGRGGCLFQCEGRAIIGVDSSWGSKLQYLFLNSLNQGLGWFSVVFQRNGYCWKDHRPVGNLYLCVQSNWMQSCAMGHWGYLGAAWAGWPWVMYSRHLFT